MKTTNSFYASVIAIVAALIACCLLSGCLCCNCSKKAVYLPIEPEHGIPATQVVGSGTNAPLSYQWYSTNGAQPTATFSVTATGARTLSYQWYVGTNGSTAASTVQAVQGTNGAPYYQWFINTNN
jgi:hypothetical protein